jgi:predicted ATPase
MLAFDKLCYDKDALMFQVGHLLWTKASTIFLAKKIFLVTSLVNYGTNVITDQAERHQAAALNLEDGIKAAALSVFPDSSRHFTAGIEFWKGGDH